jgi:hypothetical protein
MKKIKLLIILFFTIFNMALAQNEPADTGVVHALRELTSEAFDTKDHTGIANTELVALKAEANKLRDLVKDIAPDFKVFDYGSYPMLTQMGKEADNDKLFTIMEANIAAMTPAVPNYLLIGKHIDSESGKVSFKVRLKLPIVGNKGISGGINLESAENIVRFSLNKNNSDFDGKQEVIAIESLSNYLKSVAYETDGHYSTVYLVSLLLGLDEATAFELAYWTEYPDTKIHNSTQFEMNDTWKSINHQQETHSLTGGFHGTEELLTALEFLYTDINDKKQLGRLLHRFGDTYAHTDLDNSKNWEQESEINIKDHLEPWAKYINEAIKIEGLKFLIDEPIQKKYLKDKNFEDYLSEIWLRDKTSKFKMYGNKFYTLQHLIKHGSEPDFIIVRPNWYLMYVKNLARIIAYKYNKQEINSFNIDVFIKMTNYLKKNSIKTRTLKGIIDYEIAKKLNKNEVIVPVFYSNTGAAIVDATGITGNDYQNIAKGIVEQTKQYMLEQDKILKTDVEIIYWNTGTYVVTRFGLHADQAYKIKW